MRLAQALAATTNTAAEAFVTQSFLMMKPALRFQKLPETPAELTPIQGR
jgi:hypothetical protein